MNTLYLARGSIRVKPKGYWFTLGGEKGSFGYYPHLKDRNGRPVYPDTQLHGNLMMALDWLSELKNLHLDVNGRITSLVFVSDLKISDTSVWSDDRFQIKPRIEIDDEFRTVSTHMLAFLEMAYLEGIELQADIYTGYLKNRDELNRLKDQLSDAIQLMGATGAFRSRGAGRGSFSIEWDKDMEFLPEESPGIQQEILYTLTSLLNFRNKPVEPGSYQNITTFRHINSEQFRGWLVKAYHELYNEWPSIEQVSSIRFSSLYPSINKNDKIKIAYPPPMSTLRSEDGSITDMTGRPSTEDETASSLIRAKRKALPDDAFITDGHTPEVLRVSSEGRIRNALDDTFVSLKEGGLFVQEYIPSGQTFGNYLSFDVKADDKFLKRIYYILENLYPLIKGCLFEPSTNRPVEEDFSFPQSYYLLTEPVAYNESLLSAGEWVLQQDGSERTRSFRDGANMLKLTTVMNYNTTLSRPRRPRIVFQPGSVLVEPINGKTISWEGFGGDAKWLSVESEHKLSVPEPKRLRIREAEKLAEKLSKLSRSHIGFLRNFLNRNIPLKTLKRWAEDRLEKYRDKEKHDLAGLYKQILTCIDEDPDGDRMRSFLEEFIDRIRLLQWRNMKKEGESETL